VTNGLDSGLIMDGTVVEPSKTYICSRYEEQKEDAKTEHAHILRDRGNRVAQLMVHGTDQ
jgi:hypothetical protein